MPNNLRCTTDSEHQCEHIRSFLESEDAVSNLHAGFQNQGGKKQNGSGYQATAIFEFFSFKQTESLNTKRNMAYNMYALRYQFHKHVMYSTPNIMLESKSIDGNI